MAEEKSPVSPLLSLSRELRVQTEHEHRETETAPLMRAIIKGEVDRSGYAALLVALLPVYRALEESLLAQHEDPRFAFIDLRRLGRTSALEADIAHLGAAISGEVGTSDEASDYVARVRDVAAGDPVLLLSHAYTRYMGDLSGGQILGRIVAKNLDLTQDAGASFFAFPQVVDIERAKNEFRTGLDAIELDGQSIQRLVLEAKLSFRLNRLLAQQLWYRLNASARAAAAS